MTQFAVPAQVCEQCGRIVAPEDLACPTCGRLVHIARLTELSQQAQALEPTNPTAAAVVWRQCLRLLPEECTQARMVRQRVQVLESGRRVGPVVANTWSSAIVRTGGSMVVSMVVYAYALGEGWAFAVGFVLLIWVHEMGHVWALRHYKIRGSPPLFVPFVGAVITSPRMANALQEAIIGIGGPVMGTVGSLVCFGLYQVELHGGMHRQILLDLSYWGFLMNLFNLLPIPPLDGGRVTAAVSPWIWPLGLVALLGLALKQFKDSGYTLGGVSPALLLILFLAPPRVWRVIRQREGSEQYYQIGRKASQAMGVAYVVLAAVLFGMWRYAGYLGAQ